MEHQSYDINIKYFYHCVQLEEMEVILWDKINILIMIFSNQATSVILFSFLGIFNSISNWVGNWVNHFPSHAR